LVVTGGRTAVVTRVEISGDAPMNLQVTAVLVRSGQDWRVDNPATVREISRDSQLVKLLEQLQWLGARVSADLNQSLEELNNAVLKLTSELSNIEQTFRAQLPHVRD
jgi:ABC-type cobalamin transport system ATPase subunit